MLVLLWVPGLICCKLYRRVQQEQSTNEAFLFLYPTGQKQQVTHGHTLNICYDSRVINYMLQLKFRFSVGIFKRYVHLQSSFVYLSTGEPHWGVVK